MSKSIHDQITYHLKLLKLPHIRDSYQEISEKAAKSKLSYDEYLALIFEECYRRKYDVSTQRNIKKA